MQFTESRFKKWGHLSAFRFAFNANKTGKSVLLSIHIRDPYLWIGNVRLFNWHDSHKSAEISFLFFDSDHWNLGYATEALDAILSFAHESLGVRKVYGDYYEPNIASERLFSKLGFSVEGRAREQFLILGNPVDSIRVGRILRGKSV
jgi:RimJ/RimL family protein N-acetyltransferase